MKKIEDVTCIKFEDKSKNNLQIERFPSCQSLKLSLYFIWLFFNSDDEFSKKQRNSESEKLLRFGAFFVNLFISLFIHALQYINIFSKKQQIYALIFAAFLKFSYLNSADAFSKKPRISD